MSAAPSTNPPTSLATLFKYWPHTTPSAFEIAEAGFRYIGIETNDEVICPHCNQQLHNWAPEENDEPKTPWQYHKEFSPRCQFFTKESNIASKHSKAPHRPPPPSRSTDQAALLQQSAPPTAPTYQTAATQTAETQTTATSSPPPYKPNHLTIQDLYTRYAPLKNRQVTPSKTLPTMSLNDLFKRFDKKPAMETPQTTPPKARQQQARPSRHRRVKQKKKAYITSGGPSLPRTDNTPSPTSSLPRVDGQRILDSLRASNVRNGSIMRLRQ